MVVLYTTERDYPYGALRSTHAAKCKVVLEEKGIPYRIQTLRPGDLWKKPPELTAKHPLGKVPYLETDDGQVIYDSTVINEYLEEQYPTPPLLPKDPMQRARARMLENYGDEAVLTRDLPLIWMAWWQKPEQRNEGQMQNGRNGLRKKVFPFLENELADQAFLCGAFSLADIPFMAMAMVLEQDATELTGFPRLAGYLERLRQRPSYRAISPRTPVDEARSNV